MSWRVACSSAAILAVGGLLLFGSACSRLEGGNEATDQKRMTHENGLTITIPERGYDVSKTAAGFQLVVSGSRRTRSPSAIEIELHEGGSPVGSFPLTRSLERGKASYRIDVSEGGSGGEERTLTAWVAAGAGYVLLRQTIQAESPGDSAFDPAWTLLGSARVTR
jgi:hypothetical protein